MWGQEIFRISVMGSVRWWEAARKTHIVGVRPRTWRRMAQSPRQGSAVGAPMSTSFGTSSRMPGCPRALSGNISVRGPAEVVPAWMGSTGVGADPAQGPCRQNLALSTDEVAVRAAVDWKACD